MSFQHNAGSAPEWSCGQGVPRVNRTVQTRVMLDALVSNKTFGNATSAPACSQIILATSSADFAARSKLSNKIFVSTRAMNDDKTNRSPSARTSLSIRTRPPSRCEMLERMEKFKYFFTAFLTGVFPKGKIVVS